MTGAILAAAHAVAERALSELQAILSEARLNETAVAWLTWGAVATGPEEGAAGLSRAPLWGLVRSARAEHPERRLRLLDVDARMAQRRLCWRGCCRRQRSRSWRSGMVRWWRRGWCVRGRGRVSPAGEPRRLEPEGTVLITGGRGRAGSGAGAAPGRSSRGAAPAVDVASRAGDAGSAGAGGRAAGTGCGDGAGGELRRIGSGSRCDRY